MCAPSWFYAQEEQTSFSVVWGEGGGTYPWTTTVIFMTSAWLPERFKSTACAFGKIETPKVSFPKGLYCISAGRCKGDVETAVGDGNSPKFTLNFPWIFMYLNAYSKILL